MTESRRVSRLPTAFTRLVLAAGALLAAFAGPSCASDVVARAETHLLPDIKSVRAILADEDGGFTVIGGLKPAPKVAAALVRVGRDRRPAAPVLIPAPALGSGVSAFALFPEGATRLGNGDLIVVGSVETRSGAARARGFTGWAARVTPAGETVWSRSWPGAGAANQEFFYFARPIGDGELLIGGKLQKGEACHQDSSGVLLRVRSGDGGLIGSRALVDQGAKRQGFRDAYIHADGSATLAGWISDAVAPGQSCTDDVWLAKYSPAEGRASTFARPKLGGSAVALSLTPSIDGLLVGGYVRPPEAADAGFELVLRPDRLAPLDFELVRPADGAGARIVSLASAPAGIQLAAGYAARAEQERSQAWLRLFAANRACGGDLVLESGDAAFDDARALAAAMANDGTILVGGEARQGGVQTTAIGWLASIAPHAAAAPGAKTIDLGSLAGEGSTTLLVHTAEQPRAAPVSFTLAAPRSLRIAARQLAGKRDVDLILRSGAGEVVAISDHRGGTELMERNLAAGSYRIEVVATGGAAYLSLTVESRSETPAAERDAALADINGRTSLERALIHKELRLLGFDAGSDPTIAAGAQSVRAVRSFQASQCRPVSGRLTAEDEHRLAASAALVEVRRGLAAQRSWAEADARRAYVEHSLQRDDGTSELVRLATLGRRVLGRHAFENAVYEGELAGGGEGPPFDGHGRHSGGDYELTGRIRGNRLVDHGQAVLPGGDLLLGRIVTFADYSGSITRLALHAGTLIPNDLDLVAQPSLGTAYDGCQPSSDAGPSLLTCIERAAQGNHEADVQEEGPEELEELEDEPDGAAPDEERQ